MTAEDHWKIICQQAGDFDNLILPTFEKMVNSKKIQTEENEIIRLDFSAMGINFLPKHSYNLSKLRILLLSPTEIKTLDDDIGKLQNLEMLIIRSPLLETLPFGITKLLNLRMLGLLLRFQVLKKLPKEINRWFDTLREKGCTVTTRPIERQNIRRGT